jgi:hypothetical protein
LNILNLAFGIGGLLLPIASLGSAAECSSHLHCHIAPLCSAAEFMNLFLNILII